MILSQAPPKKYFYLDLSDSRRSSAKELPFRARALSQ